LERNIYMAEEKLIVSDRPERAANDLTDQIERVPVIVYRLVLMVSSTNTADDDGVMMYDILTGEYYGQFPNGPGEFNPVSFQNPTALAAGFYAGLPASFVGCEGYTSPSISGVPKIMYFNTNGDYNILTWLSSIVVSNCLCYSAGFLYLLTTAGTVLCFNANSGAPAGVSGNPGDATFIPASSLPAGTSYGGLAFSPEVIGGNLYISSGNEILIFSAVTGQQLNTIQYAGFQQPTTLAFNSTGMLYVYDSGSVLLFNGGTGQPVGTLIPAGTAGIPQGQGGLCVCDWADGPAVYLAVGSTAGSVWQFDGTTGAFEQVIVPAGSGGLNDPVSIMVGIEVPGQPLGGLPGIPPQRGGPPPRRRFPWLRMPWRRKPFIHLRTRSSA